jgi:signal transduction histidine kinase
MDEPKLAARLLRYGDDLRHEVERTLHRTTQQRLLALGLDLRAASPEAPEEHRASLERIADGIEAVLDDLRALSEWLYPAVLSRGGLAPALRAHARTLRVPVELEIDGCEQSEAATYYAIADALSAVAARPEATYVHARVVTEGDVLRVNIRHDGAATPIKQELLDRIAALGGRIKIGEDAAVLLEIPSAPRR